MSHLRNRPVFNRQVMLRRLGGDEELMGEVLALFLEQSGRMMADVDEAVSSENAHGVARSAHTIKGALLNIAAESASVVAEQLEHLGREGEIGTCKNLLSTLEAEMDRLKRELAAP